MNYESPDGGFSIVPDAFLPVLLLAVSLLMFFIWQVTGLSTQRSSLKMAIQRQDTLVSQSKQVETKLQGLALDLLKVAETDDVAKAIVTKYNIQHQQPASGGGL